MDKRTLTPAQRRAEIKRVLLTQETASIDELCGRFDASPATIRRDLDQLEQEAPIERTHGGAMIRQVRQAEQDFAARESQDIHEKQAIAQAVIAMIKPRSTIFMNDGSTVMAVAKAIVAAGVEAFVATPAVNVAIKLSESAKITSCLLGGIVRQSSMATAGPFTDSMAREINADLAIISPDGIDASIGGTFIHPHDAALAKRMSAQSAATIVVATHSKLQRRERITSIAPSDISMLVTGGAAEQLKDFRQAHLAITAVRRSPN